MTDEILELFNSLPRKEYKKGKGVKQCSCGKFFPARQEVCDCGKRYEKQITVKICDKVTRGRKQCSCGTIVGVRVENCPSCGQKIEKKEKLVPVEDRPSRYLGGKIIFTPSGAPVSKLKSEEYDDVADWCEAIQSYGILNQVTYHIDAFIYWARYFAEIGSDKYKKIISNISEWDFTLAENYGILPSESE